MKKTLIPDSTLLMLSLSNSPFSTWMWGMNSLIKLASTSVEIFSGVRYVRRFRISSMIVSLANPLMHSSAALRPPKVISRNTTSKDE
ncbi:hypothetical protein D3C87_1728220 [compost metagenome]